MEQLIIQLISGAVGGNAAGSAMKNLSLGTLGNTIAGLVGGAGGGQLIALLGSGAALAGGGGDIMGMVTQAAGGAGGGAILTAIVGMIKSKMSS
ncbi:hypothetical protein [Loktanella sp. S4079]|uniref:hypothetical protein n=1 Tax=Loktanella sp. S4079 TaxID=579483 RepID=UPI0005FA0592|nr:hypothetical protein [Loktanella sp. S4079]KJZ17976.1 DNA methyltransferase [Loktanella sp. S4079]